MPDFQDEPHRWQQVIERDPQSDGLFFYGVTTTGIYCRPVCPSRRPNPENVRFFDTAKAAQTAGFRACKRCRPDQVKQVDVPLSVAAEVCRLIENSDTPPTLDALAEQAGYSPHHLQKLFTEKVGVSPKQYADALRQHRLRVGLQSGNGVADAVYGAGYASVSRVYENTNKILGMTPASYAKGGAGADIVYGLGTSPLGLILIAETDKGLCMLSLGVDENHLIHELATDFPKAQHTRDDRALAPRLRAVLDHLEGRKPHLDLPLDVQATAFQWQVWQALQSIPAGETRTYGELAAVLGKPKAARAVGRACATNPVSLVVPCHRAVGASGDLTGYRWGVERKRTLLARERAMMKALPPEK